MLAFKNICCQIDGKEILKNINLEINDRFVAVTGPNGSGKSTLLKTAMGIVKPASGRVELDGEDITELSVTERAKRGMSFAFQQPVRFKGLTVRDLLELAGGNAGNGKHGERFAAACDILGEVGLCAGDYLDRELDGTLSGGEMKRIEIAMAAARGTEITLFDEPEAGIDLWSFNNLIRIFENLYKKTSGTIVIITHQERILNIADKIVYLKDGEISDFGDGTEVMRRLSSDVCPKNCDAYGADRKNCALGREVR